MQNNLAPICLFTYNRLEETKLTVEALQNNFLARDSKLFIFSDVLESNRSRLIEGSSLIITLIKTISNDENKFKRINVQKVAPLKDLFNKSVNEIIFNIKSTEEMSKISDFLKEKGTTVVKININDEKNEISFQLKDKRFIDRKAINILRNNDISAIIQ